MPRRRTDTIGRAGEHYAAAELNRRGAYASPFSGNVPGIDIVATNQEMTSMAYVQVKTKSENSRNWQVGLRTGWAKVIPYGCLENGECPKECTPRLDEPISGKPDHYWIFVSLLKCGGQQYYIVPDKEVREVLVRKWHQDYLKKHGGQRPGSKHDSDHYSFHAKRLEPWENRWDFLGLWPEQQK